MCKKNTFARASTNVKNDLLSKIHCFIRQIDGVRRSKTILKFNEEQDVTNSIVLLYSFLFYTILFLSILL